MTRGTDVGFVNTSAVPLVEGASLLIVVRAQIFESNPLAFAQIFLRQPDWVPLALIDLMITYVALSHR
jgi:hypothetical protein